jgi:hypothetical protein
MINIIEDEMMLMKLVQRQAVKWGERLKKKLKMEK